MYNVCLEGESAKSNTRRFVFLTMPLPIILMVVLTGFLDLSCYFWLQKRDNTSRNTPQNRCCKNDIPLRATAISISLHILCIIGFVILAMQKVEPHNKYLVVAVGARIGNILRNPLTAVFTFKINDETRRKNAALERERRRQSEIQSAFRKRQEHIELQGT